MTKRQSQKLAMYMVIVRSLRNHPALPETTPALEPLIAELERLIDAIQHTVSRRNHFSKGLALAKSASRAELIEQAYRISQAIQAWAAQSGEAGMARRYGMTLSGLKNLRHADLPAQVETLLEQARTLGVALEPFGVTAAQIDAVQATRARYLELIAQPRMAIVRYGTETAQIGRLFREADALLRERMDPLLNSGRNSEAYSDYSRARKLAGARRKSDPAGPDAGPAAPVDPALDGLTARPTLVG